MKILIFKTFPLSLSSWNEIGILNRELSIYKKLNNIYNIDYSLITFGDQSDRNYESAAYLSAIYNYKRSFAGISPIPVPDIVIQ